MRGFAAGQLCDLQRHGGVGQRDKPGANPGRRMFETRTGDRSLYRDAMTKARVVSQGGPDTEPVARAP